MMHIVGNGVAVWSAVVRYTGASRTIVDQSTESNHSPRLYDGEAMQ